MTKMLRRSDVLSAVMKRINNRWEVGNRAYDEGDFKTYGQVKGRLDELRWVKDALHGVPSFIAAEYASDSCIPKGEEWAERIRIAGELTNAPNGADMAMLRLLADLRKPLEELQEDEAAMFPEEQA